MIYFVSSRTQNLNSINPISGLEPWRSFKVIRNDAICSVYRLLLLVCSNDVTMLYCIWYIITFTEWVTACDIEKSISWTGHNIHFLMHVKCDKHFIADRAIFRRKCCLMWRQSSPVILVPVRDRHQLATCWRLSLEPYPAIRYSFKSGDWQIDLNVLHTSWMVMIYTLPF